MPQHRALISEAFGLQLRSLRQSRGIELPSFAQTLALSRPYVWQVENGVRHPFSLRRLRCTRKILALTNAEFSDLVYTATQEYFLAVEAADFTKPRDVLHLVSLLAAYDKQIPRDFFTRTTAWIEEHCR